MSSFGKIYSYPNNPRVSKALISAKYNGLDVEVVPIEMAKTKNPEFLVKFPMGKIPAFEASNGETLFESSAIAYYVAGAKIGGQLLGKNLFEGAEVQQWVSFSDNEVFSHFGPWLYPILYNFDYNHLQSEASKAKIQRSMAALNTHLARKTYLVGECITLADISVSCALLSGYIHVFDPAFRAPYKHVNRWFKTCINQAQFHDVLGDVKFCEKMKIYQKPKEEKKEVKAAAPKPAAPKAAKKPKEADEEPEESFEDEKPKGKNPLDLLPPSTLNLDEWKRCYSNNETRPTAVDWFWANYDPKGYTMYKVDYKYNDELTMTFMSSNLVGGFFQRLERARKYAFGSMLVLGTDNKNKITGYFIVRGDGIPPEISEAADYESYTFTKVDTSSKDVKEAYNAVIAWDEKIEGMPFADGKVFK